MRSKAHIKSHPLHPLLVSFPIAFFIGALVLDALAFATENDKYLQAACYSEIGGLIGAIVAAVPGMLDYIYTVPPKSSAKKRATTHAIVNGTIVSVFAVTLWLRDKHAIGLPLILTLETIGVVLIGITGWLGGTLVARNQIGIDHRYANAGKWHEETITSEDKIVELKNTDAIKVNQMRLLHVNDKRIVIARIESGLVAFDDHCTHRGGSLADGVMICGTVQCPWHGSQFSVQNGNVKAGPAIDNIITYPITTDGNRVLLKL